MMAWSKQSLRKGSLLALTATIAFSCTSKPVEPRGHAGTAITLIAERCKMDSYDYVRLSVQWRLSDTSALVRAVCDHCAPLKSEVYSLEGKDGAIVIESTQVDAARVVCLFRLDEGWTVKSELADHNLCDSLNYDLAIPRDFPEVQFSVDKVSGRGIDTFLRRGSAFVDL